MQSTLAQALAYENDEVVHRFAQERQIELAEAREIFLETKRWLWFCAKTTRAIRDGQAEFFPIPLFNEAYAIDQMWHTFLLYTVDYANFCETYFGFFVHHYPKPRAEKLAWTERLRLDPENAKQEHLTSLRKVYELIHDDLGADVLRKWCEEFPSRFAHL